jgi:ATP-binding cassette, subfamily F, member 3
MLTMTNLTYRIAGRTILENCSLNVMDGWKVGVVGLNGTGKSTLFKLIAGELHADMGDISLSTRQRLGMVRQDIPECDTPLIDLVVGADVEMAALLAASETETDPYKIGDIHERLAELDAYTAPTRAAILLTGLGFKESQLQEPFSSLSGGWRMRVALAAALFLEPDVLLLDEPTNHLDLEAIMWLDEYLVNYPHTLMIISHDRDLLNKCCDHVVHVDQKKLTLYTGNYDTFERERAERLGLQQKMHEKQKAHREHMQAFIDRFRAKASKARQAQSRIKALEKMDIVDAVIAQRAISFTFPQPEELPPHLITIDGADVGYEPGKPILRNINQEIDMDDRIALMGANGNGKSTLTKLLSGTLTALQGDVKKHPKLRIGYFSQHQTEEMDMSSTAFDEMKKLMYAKNPGVTEPQVRAKLGSFGFSKDLADNKIQALSGGEKARLMFALISFDAPHILLLDEPTNHLDIDAREALVQALNDYNGAVILVSHDPSMVERVADRLWLVKDSAVHPFDGDLNDYRNFIVETRRKEKRGDKKRKESVSAEPLATAKLPPPRELVRKAEQTERNIARLTTEKTKVEEELARLFAMNDVAGAATVQKKFDKLCAELTTSEGAWLELQNQLEQFAA